MCERPRVGKNFFHFAGLIGAAICVRPCSTNVCIYLPAKPRVGNCGCSRTCAKRIKNAKAGLQRTASLAHESLFSNHVPFIPETEQPRPRSAMRKQHQSAPLCAKRHDKIACQHRRREGQMNRGFRFGYLPRCLPQQVTDHGPRNRVLSLETRSFQTLELVGARCFVCSSAGFRV
jgi:hypothetical protein